MSSQTLQLIWPHHGGATAARGATAISIADRVDVAIGPLAVRTRRLSGGLREGVLLVELVAGTTKVFVLPDRGLGIWKVMCGDVELGWQSPVHGPVHPRFVPLSEPSGLGWLDGFDELVARCGMVSNGAPDFDDRGRLRHGLHGRIANLPAHHLDVTLDDSSGTITLSGAVDELAPRDEIAVPDVPTWNRYDAPRGGRREEVHFARLRADAAGLATAVLVGPDRHKGASLTWRAATLPCFALWKNQGGLADGYVTGLEPATNYPNPRSHEESQGRVVPLDPGASARFDLAIELLDEKQIAAARSAAAALAGGVPATIHSQPKPGWSVG